MSTATLTSAARAYLRPTPGVGDVVAGVCLCHGYRVRGGVVVDFQAGTIRVIERTLVRDEPHALDGVQYVLVETLADAIARLQ